MNSDLTELVFIIDRSGSMAGLEDDTIGGFNSMIARQKQAEGRACVSTVLFSDRSTVIHDRVDLQLVKRLTAAQYTVGGCTALLDAVGQAISHISDVHRRLSERERPARTLFVITTDGRENASRLYNLNQVRHMIERQKACFDWEFLFLGANIDAADAAADIGIDRRRAATYRSDSEGTRLNYEVLSDAICSVRACAPIADDWAAPIEADRMRRR